MPVKHYRVVICGLPGVGKTEHANQIIKKARDSKKDHKGIGGDVGADNLWRLNR